MNDDRNFDIFWFNSEIQVAYGMSSSTINSGDMAMIEYLLFVTKVFTALIGNKCSSAKIALSSIVELISFETDRDQVLEAALRICFLFPPLEKRHNR